MRRLVLSALAGLGALLLLPGAAAQCQPVCLGDLADVALGNAQGLVAVALGGNAEGDLLAASAGGNAAGGLVAVSGPDVGEMEAGPGVLDGGNAEGGLVAVSTGGNAEGFVAVSLTGHATGVVAVGGADLLDALRAVPPDAVPPAGLGRRGG